MLWTPKDCFKNSDSVGKKCQLPWDWMKGVWECNWKKRHGLSITWAITQLKSSESWRHPKPSLKPPLGLVNDCMGQFSLVLNLELVYERGHQGATFFTEGPSICLISIQTVIIIKSVHMFHGSRLVHTNSTQTGNIAKKNMYFPPKSALTAHIICLYFGTIFVK